MGDQVVFNPLDPALRRDPFPTYARARREAPALVHSGLPVRLVSVFRYEDCQAILRDAQAWSSEFPLINQMAGAGGAAAAQHARHRPARAYPAAQPGDQGLHAAHDPAARAAHARDREPAARRRARAGRRRPGAGAQLSAARHRDRRDHRHPGRGPRDVQALVRRGGGIPRAGLPGRSRSRARAAPAAALRFDARVLHPARREAQAASRARIC